MSDVSYRYSGGSEGGEKYFDTDFHQMSHELRNPLNSINGFAELLLQDASLSPASIDYVRAILTGSQILNETVLAYLDRAEPIDGTSDPARMASPEAQPVSHPGTFQRARRAGSPRKFRRSQRYVTL